MSNITLVKTLPHLIPWHVEQFEVSVFSTSYNIQIDKFLRGLNQLDLKGLARDQLVSYLREAQFLKVEHIAPGTYTVKGDTLAVWPIGYTEPVRINYFDQEYEVSATFDLSTGKSLERITHLFVSSHRFPDMADAATIQINPLSAKLSSYVFLPFVPERFFGKLEVKEFDFDYPPLFWQRMDLFEQEISRLRDLSYSIQIITRHSELVPEGLRDLTHHNFEGIELAAGFVSGKLKQAVYTDREIFGTVFLKNTDPETGASAKLLRQLEGEIKPGDFLVHQDHGIGIYAGITQEMAEGEMLEYLQINYAGEDKLYVPIAQVGKLTKYIGYGSTPPKITKLNGTSWDVATKKVKHSVAIMAKELVEHYARREMAKAKPVSGEDSSDYLEFVRQFPFTETKDQIRATNEIVADMEQELPMNRLLIGDVGFGKTEVMMRAAFKMVEAGFQVAVLAPTTVLTAQHLAVFKERFKNFPVNIVSLSRFTTTKQNQEMVDQLNQGKVDIVIGTHRLLSRDVKFKNLGLLIVDEEQRFGVKQKERIKQLNYGVHHLAVSATPIPRTLSMALANIQTISIMTTAPVDRLPIHTELIKDDWGKVVNAINSEIGRGGQVYVVHNRVQSLPSVQAKLLSLIPGLKVKIAHGQMSPTDLDSVMGKFYKHEFDVLICTTIVENGLDLPNVNTVIIDRAHTFGLSQLYQLRGRVGRSGRQAFCYLFYQGKDLTVELGADAAEVEEQIKKYLPRLQSIIDANELGAGFTVASRDLELRGAGTLLGEKQSGHIVEVGYALYMKMLATEIDRLKTAQEPKTEFLTL